MRKTAMKMLASLAIFAILLFGPYAAYAQGAMDAVNCSSSKIPVESYDHDNLWTMDYLQELGVTCLWLLPFFPSPLRDDGYDISDYHDISPPYGKMADFQSFLDEAHRRGMAVLIELVVNHTSDQHPWFQRARKAPPGSPERDWYVGSDTDRRYADARIIFLDT